MPRFKNPYKTERDLAESFAEAVRSQGWVVYPETGGYDLLLVAGSGVNCTGIVPGDQIGVEAKLQANLKVLEQARAHIRRPRSAGPNFVAVLVPRAVTEFRNLADDLGLLVIEGTRRGRSHPDFGPVPLPFVPTHHRLYYPDPCSTPARPVDIPAGVPSPRSVTPWKVKAIRLCLLAEEKGYLTSADFRRDRVSMSRWKRNRWLEPTGEHLGKFKKYRLKSEVPPWLPPPPHVQWPEIVEALRDTEARVG